MLVCVCNNLAGETGLKLDTVKPATSIPYKLFNLDLTIKSLSIGLSDWQHSHEHQWSQGIAVFLQSFSWTTLLFIPIIRGREFTWHSTSTSKLFIFIVPKRATDAGAVKDVNVFVCIYVYVFLTNKTSVLFNLRTEKKKKTCQRGSSALPTVLQEKLFRARVT